MATRGGSDNRLEAQFAELSGKVEMFMELNSKQHDEIATRLFSDSPNSIQGQINTISERAFGDSSTSLRSRLTEIEGSAKISKGIWAFVAAFFASLGTLVGLKWESIARALRTLAH